jgi:uncharacterized protein (DUF433 family)
VAVETNIGSLITRDPRIRGGRAIVTGTGVTVMRIAGWAQQGLTPAEIVAEIPNLALAQVHAALAYYYANRSEIERELTDEAAEYDRLAQEHGTPPNGR